MQGGSEEGTSSGDESLRVLVADLINQGVSEELSGQLSALSLHAEHPIPEVDDAANFSESAAAPPTHSSHA